MNERAAPPVGGDYFMVCGLHDTAQPDEPPSDIYSCTETLIVVAATEEEAVAKAAEKDPTATLFTAQVVPTFPPPPPADEE